MYARRVLGDKSDTAEDVVQEAYLRLLGLAASDEAPTSARPWLFRVVRNLAIDERRSAARRADPVADTAILGTAALDDTAQLVEQREEIAGAFRDIAALPPRERKALEMDQAGIGAQAIAAELGTTPNAVHQALFRARKRIRAGRAVAWGLIPIGLAPFLLRLSDPALAVTFTNLPAGAPIGRALPVAGIVAAAMVGGSVVAPSVAPNPRNVPAINFVHTTNTSTSTDSSNDGAQVRSASSSRVSSTTAPTSAKSGKDTEKSGSDDSGDSSKGSGRSRNRGQGGGDDSDGNSGKHRSGKSDRTASGSGGDSGSDSSGSRHRSGSGKSADKPSDDPTKAEVTKTESQDPSKPPEDNLSGKSSSDDSKK
jgi:RNA polymerase sigma factor (sigma-70 family)